ncbi:hypothetical protein [Sphingobacterium sp.]|uniref:hypothetical protein n=1 Tax=Sphingobacterium sp. TaxID=341027 RepID=UPI00289827F2|nr:hypothetical protein [Sphingobacterium sp.]
MDKENRFQDQNKVVSDFYHEVWVVCQACGKKAVAKADYNAKQASLYCDYCGYHKRATTDIYFFGIKSHAMTAAHFYFKATLWLQHPFKSDVFWAYNGEHLNYLEDYIGAKLREHKDREHFTLLEKLPKFYHEAKNRKALLAIINRLRKK